MDEPAWLRRIDRRLERGDALMDEVREEMRRNRDSTERLFKRQDELVVQSNAVWRDAIRVLRELASEVRDLRAEARDLRAEARADARAHREALFRILDRLDRPDPGGSPA